MENPIRMDDFGGTMISGNIHLVGGIEDILVLVKMDISSPK